jgi:hypothetical protein
MLLLKLDIAKAFDNVRWEYLLEVMEKLGFDPRWRDMMALIWSTTTLRIMLNGSHVSLLNMPRAFVRVIQSPLCYSYLQWTLCSDC